MEDLDEDFAVVESSDDGVAMNSVAVPSSLEEEDYSESSEEESIKEEYETDEFDINWMRLKVPLAAQNPEAMRRLVEQGREL